ncbi:MAG: hypothetical protein M1836_004222 [Candelina mexicana]|nr:MAG: hypothetical protein M1836_004222 [Candelina mexicana]
MAYTSATMHAILPGLGSMPDIGSVAANFARNREEDDTREFLRVDKRASFVRYNFGEALFDDYQADVIRRTPSTVESPQSGKKRKTLVRRFSGYLRKKLRRSKV